MITHRDMHYTETETENCPICSDIYASIEERKAHIDLHLIKTFICAFCDKEFVSDIDSLTVDENSNDLFYYF